MNLDKHIEAFDKVLKSKWDCKIYRLIHRKISLLNRMHKDYDRPNIYMDLLTTYYIGGHDRRFDPMKASLPTYVKHFVNRKLSHMIRHRRHEIEMDYNTTIYDDEIFYGGENDPGSMDKLMDFRRYAESHDRLDEFEILAGYKDYSDLVEMYSKEYDALRQRVSRLKRDFENWYEAQ